LTPSIAFIKQRMLTLTLGESLPWGLKILFKTECVKQIRPALHSNPTVSSRLGQANQVHHI